MHSFPLRRPKAQRYAPTNKFFTQHLPRQWGRAPSKVNNQNSAHALGEEVRNKTRHGELYTYLHIKSKMEAKKGGKTMYNAELS